MWCAVGCVLQNGTAGEIVIFDTTSVTSVPLVPPSPRGEGFGCYRTRRFFDTLNSR